MIEFPYDSPSLDTLRAQTAALLECEITDDNGLMADLLEVGFLSQPVSGYLGAMVLQFESGVEFFAGRMPGERGLTTNGGANFHYESIHNSLIRERDAMNAPLPHGQAVGYQTGLLLAIGGELHYSNRTSFELAEAWDRDEPDIAASIAQAASELGLAGEIPVGDIVADTYTGTVDIHSPTRALRVAAKWKQHTLTPPYDPRRRRSLARVLTEAEGRAGLTAELGDLVAEKLRRDIDIIEEVTGL